MRRLYAAALLVATAVLAAEAQAPPGNMVEWPYVGGDQAHTKYSPLRDVTQANVDRLRIAWQWDPAEQPLPEYGTRPGAFEATPLMIDNVLYLSTMYTRVVALDAETGRRLWAFDPRAYENGPRGSAPGGFKHRGVAFWRGDGGMRLFLNSRDTLYSLDAATGELIARFGNGGRVPLTD